jgi:hypothetical protein
MSNEDAVPPTGEKESTLDLAREFAIAYDDGTFEFDEDSLGRFVDVLRVEIARELYVAPTAEQAEGVPQIKPRLLSQLRRFNECCEDSEADGHDVDKEDMCSLAELGAVRPAPGGRHYMTDFGHYLIAAPAASTGDQA